MLYDLWGFYVVLQGLSDSFFVNQALLGKTLFSVDRTDFEKGFKPPTGQRPSESHVLGFPWKLRISSFAGHPKTSGWVYKKPLRFLFACTVGLVLKY